MNITLMMVASVNGKITDGVDPIVSHWTSKEDQKLFALAKETYSVILMGRATYEVAKTYIHPQDTMLRIVMTKHVENYANDTIPNKLEFTDLSPAHIIDMLEKRGYKELLMVGGAEINSLFFAAKLIDELHITIEPKLYGTGKNLLADIASHVDMELREVQKLNPSGTLHIKYKIKK